MKCWVSALRSKTSVACIETTIRGGGENSGHLTTQYIGKENYFIWPFLRCEFSNPIKNKKKLHKYCNQNSLSRLTLVWRYRLAAAEALRIEELSLLAIIMPVITSPKEIIAETVSKSVDIYRVAGSHATSHNHISMLFGFASWQDHRINYYNIHELLFRVRDHRVRPSEVLLSLSLYRAAFNLPC